VNHSAPDDTMFVNQSKMREFVSSIPETRTRLLVRAAISRVMGYWVRPENLAALLANPVDVHGLAVALCPLFSNHETISRVLSGEISSLDEFPDF
jgi:hypothetical protein